MSSIEYKSIDTPLARRLSALHGNVDNCEYIWVVKSTDANSQRRLLSTPRYKTYENQIKNMIVAKDQVWVCSYPKCGTTWTQEMVWLLCNNLDYDGAKQEMEDRFPFIEIPTIKDVPLERNYFEKIKSGPPAKFVKTHLPLAFLPDQIAEVKPKIVYVSRNPKDVVVSYYHHEVMLENFSGTLDDFAEGFMNDIALYSPFFEHILDFYNVRARSNVLFLRYESMKKDLLATIRCTAEFFDKHYSDEQLQKLAVHLSFDKMKANPATNKERWVNYCQQLRGNDNHKFRFIRKGEVGGWRSELTETMAKRIDEWTCMQVPDHIKRRELFDEH